MPNIEIFGFSRLGSQNLKEQIKGLLLGTPFEGIDVAPLPDVIIDKKIHPDPFIRLFSSKPPEEEGVLRILERRFPHLSIEYVKVSRLEGRE